MYTKEVAQARYSGLVHETVPGFRMPDDVQVRRASEAFRLLADPTRVRILWALLQGDGPLLLEEPELSLHPDVISYLPQMLARVQSKSGRQVILSTHSPDLLRDRDVRPDEVLLLQPKSEGTVVRPASDFGEVVSLLDGGLPLAEAIVPLTRPAGIEQLSFFGD